MKQYKQLYRHEPWNGIYGDCWRTSLGCILEIPPHRVPHFLQIQAETGRDPTAQIYNWLSERDLHMIDVPIDNIDGWFEMNKGMNAHTYYLLGGTSPRGTGHSVVARGGEIVWDPSKAGGGLVGPMSDGFYYATFIVPLRTTVAYDA